MTVSAKELRFRTAMVFDALEKGESVLVTYRGRKRAWLVPYRQKGVKKDYLFGIWSDEGDVERQVRKMREGRRFDG